MESTTRDFWKMVKERECTVVVMLCSLEENGQVHTTLEFIVIIIAKQWNYVKLLYKFIITESMSPVLAYKWNRKIRWVLSWNNKGKQVWWLHWEDFVHHWQGISICRPCTPHNFMIQCHSICTLNSLENLSKWHSFKYWTGISSAGAPTHRPLSQ